MINKQPLVSIAIITFNQKRFLKECIESCLEQDYKNIEIVIADDGSTDGTHEMLQRYSSLYPGKFILKLSKMNQGITLNSNVAHFACSGKYIAWMGGDDVMLPGKIKLQVKYMELNPKCAICYHQHEAFDSETGKVLYYSFKKYGQHSGDIQKAIKYGTFNGALATMVRRECTPSKGFDTRIPVASDWLYWIETLANGGTINPIPEVLARYRRHGNNVTSHSLEMKQNTIDHFFTCSILMAKYPKYFKIISYRYGCLLMQSRHILPYRSSLLESFKLTFKAKPIVGIVCNLLTFGRVKL